MLCPVAAYETIIQNPNKYCCLWTGLQEKIKPKNGKIIQDFFLTLRGRFIYTNACEEMVRIVFYLGR